MLRPSFAAAVLLLATCAVPTSHGATVVFFDSEFPDEAWEASIFWTLGAGGTVEVWQAATQGNPGAYRVVRNTVFDAPPYAAVAGFHRHLASTYNPALGGIVTIDYAEDAIMLAGGGQGQGAGPALRQDGQIYIGPIFITPETSWTTHQLVGLTELDFHLAGQPDVHPDFSAAGGLIKFGFVRQNSTYSGGYTILGGIDNWSMTLHTDTPVTVESATWSGVKALFE